MIIYFLRAPLLLLPLLRDFPELELRLEPDRLEDEEDELERLVAREPLLVRDGEFFREPELLLTLRFVLDLLEVAGFLIVLEEDFFRRVTALLPEDFRVLERLTPVELPEDDLLIRRTLVVPLDEPVFFLTRATFSVPEELLVTLLATPLPELLFVETALLVDEGRSIFLVTLIGSRVPKGCCANLCVSPVYPSE